MSRARDLVCRGFSFVSRALGFVCRDFSFVWRARESRHFSRNVIRWRGRLVSCGAVLVQCGGRVIHGIFAERDSVARAFGFVCRGFVSVWRARDSRHFRGTRFGVAAVWFRVSRF